MRVFFAHLTALVLLSSTVAAQQQTLMQARAGHTTKLVPSEYEPDGPADVPPAGNPYVKIQYPSKAGPLVAYLTPDPKDGKKRPAIVWAHGGFGGIGEYYWAKQPATNDQTPKAFLDAGFVVMLPSWRGENENPGKFELFYGEIDDALAAIDYVSKLPYVDSSRIYMGGHSTGGTITLLTALASDKLRAAFSFGGTPDLAEVIEAGGYGNTPFDTTNPNEARLRSAVHFVHALKTPTWYFEGSDAFGAESALKMQQAAEQAKAPFKAFILADGNHFNILRPMTTLLAQELAGDTGPALKIDLSEAKVNGAWQKALAELRAKRSKLPLVALSPDAAQRVLQMMKAQQLDPAKTYLRITEQGPDFTDKIDPATDETGESNGVKTVLNKELARDHRGLRLEFDATEKRLRLLPAAEEDLE